MDRAGSNGDRIGRLERVSLREVWPHEALDFTSWLENNIDVLSDTIGVELVNVEREQSAGSFSVDLVAEDETGGYTVIENQLEKSDHDHLGKLLTYLAAFEAKTAVWIVANPRSEHVKAIAWLNESSSASFYLLKVEAVRIGDSLPAPMLTHIVGPSIESRGVGETKQDLAEQHAMFQEFWKSLMEKASARSSLHVNLQPGRGNWLYADASEPGLSYGYIIRTNGSRVELNINRRDWAVNREIFEQLSHSKEAIEQALGRTLDWSNHDGRHACKIEMPLETRGYRDTDHWDKTQEAMIDAMIQFEQTLRPHIEQLARKYS